MEGQMRRDTIIKMLGEKGKPLSGTELAKELGVSRQVIVQDIALLRAVNKNILSTNKGYVLYDPSEETQKARRTIAVSHSDEQTQDELYTIVDFGGKVLDVVIAVSYTHLDVYKRQEQSGDSCQKIFLSQIGREIRQMLITEIPLWMQMVRLPRMWSFVIVR